jgi:hypothetical protein
MSRFSESELVKEIEDFRDAPPKEKASQANARSNKQAILKGQTPPKNAAYESDQCR